MILKFRNNSKEFGVSWEYIDGIERINIRDIEKETRQDKRFTPDYYIQILDDNKNVVEDFNNYKYIFAELKEEKGKNRGVMVTICTNMVVYLLNDEGKTIENLR